MPVFSLNTYSDSCVTLLIGYAVFTAKAQLADNADSVPFNISRVSSPPRGEP